MPLGIPRHRPGAAKTEPLPPEHSYLPTATQTSIPRETPRSSEAPVVRRSLLFSTYHVIFPVTIFLSAFLLFQLQPMMGRYILPWFGGGPAVWTACLLFFRTFLLAGYAYAHWLGSLSNVRLQVSVHVTLLAVSLLFLPITPHADSWKSVPGADPLIRILILLTVTMGGPYLLLSATAPLLQRWFTFGASNQSPWRLYALSNFGSFL